MGQVLQLGQHEMFNSMTASSLSLRLLSPSSDKRTVQNKDSNKDTNWQKQTNSREALLQSMDLTATFLTDVSEYRFFGIGVDDV